MQTISYPTNSNDPTPQIRITLIDKWTQTDVKGSVLSALKFESEKSFSPNIVTSVLEDSISSSLEVAMGGVQAYLKTLNNPTKLTDDIGVIGNREWHIAEFIFKHEIVGDVIQMIATTIEKKDETSYVYRITGTALSINAKTDFIDIRKMLVTAGIGEE